MSERRGDAPLWRNRGFVVLLAGQLLSTLGTQLTTIAYPLLVLAATGSAAQAGAVAFARLVPFAVFGLLAGVAADRWDRKVLLIGADAVRAVAVGALSAAIVLDRVTFSQVLVAAFVEGAGATLAGAAQAGALRAVVPRAQLPNAVAAQRARMSAVRLVGPPVGGALFSLARALPFVLDAVSYAFSILSLLIAPVGPLAAGFLLDATSARATIACFLAVTLALAFWGTLSRVIRDAPRLEELRVDGHVARL